ncbi:MAG: putative selenate reductase subunit YgfK [Desulfobacterales bacterium]|nr:putative selenate reductase subunit YgfK [Desulfobacterales bacterium]
MSSDKFWGCDIETMLKWILEEEKHGQIFGIRKELFFITAETDPFRMYRYGQLLETPLGVAAGPHTQLSQNLIAAWLTGARYLELKTVQVLDELEVTKPCIDMADEGYNCEWSQELKLDQSFDEYLNAWILLHILKDKFGWGVPDEKGFIFNMSVGYNLEGILSPTVQRFLDQMADCSDKKAEKIECLAKFYPRVKDLNISDCMCDNITISTMHGCPPDEVEKIGRYAVVERKLNTTIKLNPTLLGPEDVRGILNDKLGFETIVPDLAFEHDPKYDDGVALIRALLADAEKTGVEFNIKLTNTLETTNKEQNLPKNESMIYMSGRALHPISINLAARLQAEFDGKLDISFSAGTDCYNLADVIACNLKPVTVCSDILKPGGYGRLSQYLENLAKAIQESGAKTIDEFIPAQAGFKNLQAHAEKIVENKAFHKVSFPYDNIKTQRELTTFDCIQAPCMTTCPASQDIPAYMYYTAKGDYAAAHQVIMETNPFPNIQGMVCDHLCQNKCTRINYDSPLLIREVKRFIAQKSDGTTDLKPGQPNGIKVAIIGAGPSGLACAYFLALDGFEVRIFEGKEFAGGWASDAIPEFRLDNASIKKDVDRILSLGVKIDYGARIDSEKFETLRKDFDYVYIAVGAQEGIGLGVPGDDAEGVMDQLAFLSAVRRGERPNLGKKVAVVGGGNSAMDAARTAKRLVGQDGEVSVIYRRTRNEMPAADEEVQGMLDEDVKLVALTNPECILTEDGRIKASVCYRMALGEKDASGRPRPVKIEGSEFELNVDTVISAIGQRVNLDFFPNDKLEIDPVTQETQIKNVFAGGDAARGASTLIKAIGDGKKTAESIRERALRIPQVQKCIEDKATDMVELQKRRACRQLGTEMPETGFNERSGMDLVVRTLDEATAQKEADRCLQCDELCNVCVTVCPNRANIGFTMEPTEFAVQQAKAGSGGVEISELARVRIEQKSQVLNIGDYCNECGNCTTFCPTSGSPYLDKAKFHLTEDSFASASVGYYFTSADRLEYKQKEWSASLEVTDDGYIYESGEIRATLGKDYAVQKAELKEAGKEGVVNLRHAAEMAILSKTARKVLPIMLKYHS